MLAVRRELAVPGRYHLGAPEHAQRRSWWQSIAAWVGDRINEFFAWIAAHVHPGREGSAIVGDALLLGAVVLVGIVGARLLVALQLTRDRKVASASIAHADRDAQSLISAAALAATREDYASAVRALFAAAVTVLDLHGTIDDDQGATINELRRMIRTRDADAERSFGEIARYYSVAAYAQAPIDRAAWQSVRDAYAVIAASAFV
ncbi:MAG: hypothetical protein M3R51_09520 [Candidatus Eremiobacteraeota bacterium]|nr:hypothetical protein [Candidatus Eremiobacteraeota bacterium]